MLYTHTFDVPSTNSLQVFETSFLTSKRGQSHIVLPKLHKITKFHPQDEPSR